MLYGNAIRFGAGETFLKMLIFMLDNLMFMHYTTVILSEKGWYEPCSMLRSKSLSLWRSP